MPAYLPDVAREVLPWAVNHTRRVSRRYPLASLEDLWDETVTALLRASVHYRRDFGHFVPYAQTCVHRALWRYCVRPMYGSGTHGLRDLPVPWHDFSEARTPNDGLVHGMRGTHPTELHVASAETVVAAVETVWPIAQELAMERGHENRRVVPREMAGEQRARHGAPKLSGR